ncbi:MAG: BrnA antitoxin family protein [Tunicatimonas sp.]|uniref:BrnA antitoxin family protein n=1 Tax=Tunicatimonas sp. TaxID=1940096 RepID=UPI003C732863
MKKQKEKIVRYSAEEIKKMKGNTDWERVDAITDEELEEIVKNDPDDVYLSDEDLAKGTFYRKGEWIKQFEEPKKKEQITLRLDEDILSFFRETGRGYQTRINNALRAFVQAQQENHR